MVLTQQDRYWHYFRISEHILRQLYLEENKDNAHDLFNLLIPAIYEQIPYWLKIRCLEERTEEPLCDFIMMHLGYKSKDMIGIWTK